MKTFIFKFTACAVSAGIILSGCSSGPELKNYPRSEIDRPYTLPSGIAAWHIPTMYGTFSSNNAASSTIYPIPLPFLWEEALSDDWSLIWAPIPIGVNHQFWIDSSSRLGMFLSLGFSEDSETGFRFAPTLGLSYRKKLGSNLALDVSPFYTPNIPFQDGQPYRWSTGVSIGPLFQLSEFFSLEPSLSFGVHKGSVAAPNSFDPFSNVEFEEDTIYSFGTGISITWSIGRQWDFKPSYSYSGFGSSDGYRGQIAVAEFVHFW